MTYEKKMKSAWGCVLLGGMLGCTAAATAAQPSIRPLQVEDFASAVTLAEHAGIGALSRDGEWLAYLLCDPRRVTEQFGQQCDIQVVSTREKTAPRKVAGESGTNWGLSWSADGGQLAFFSNRDGAARVWMWDRTTGAQRRISDVEVESEENGEPPVWTRDGRGLLVKLPAEGADAAQAEAPPAAHGDAGASVPGSTLQLYRSEPAGATQASASIEDMRSPVDLGVIDVESGQVQRVLRNTIFHWFGLSPDGRRIAYTESIGSNIHATGINWIFRLMVLDLDGGSPRVLAPEIEQSTATAMSWAPDSRSLAYASCRGVERPQTAAIDIYMSACGNLYVASIEGSAPRRMTGAPNGVFASHVAPLWDASSSHFLVNAQNDELWRADAAAGTLRRVPVEQGVGAIVRNADQRTYWSPDNGASAYVRIVDERTLHQGFARIDLTRGRMKTVMSGLNGYGVGNFRLEEHPPLVSADGRKVVFYRQSAAENPNLFAAGVDFASPWQITQLNPKLDTYAFGEARVIDYLSTDGERRKAALLLPAGYRPGQRYPLVTWVYAGEDGSRYSTIFGLNDTRMFNLQMLATRGYAVMWPDIPVRIGTSMRDVMKSVMPAIDKAVEIGVADADRLAVMGHSNGGWSTMALLVQTQRFKAAVMNSGFSDLLGYYLGHGTLFMSSAIPPEAIGSFLERSLGAMGASPWEAPLRYVENSPIFYLDRVTTPLIIMAGSDDSCCTALSDQTFLGLKRLRKDVTYLRYGGEGHDLIAYPNLVDYWNRVTAFLDERVKRAPASTTDGASQRLTRK